MPGMRVSNNLEKRIRYHKINGGSPGSASALHSTPGRDRRKSTRLFHFNLVEADVRFDKFSRVTRIRMLWCAIYALVLLLVVAWIAPQQVPVITYKMNLVLLAAVSGYWLDRWAFPYARPDRFLTAAGEVMVNHKRVFGAAMLRRAIIMGACMLAVGMGL